MRLALLLLVLGALFGLTSPAVAQNPEVMKRVMEGMRTHTLTGQVMIMGDDGQMLPAPAGMDVGFQVKVFGRAKKGALMFKTEDGGKVTFTGIRSNKDPQVQAQMTYEAFVDYEGVRFPFPVEMIPTDGMELSPFTVYAVSKNLQDIALIVSVDVIPSEQSIHVTETYQFVNRSRKAVDLSVLPGGGLVLTCPEGAKQPELHENNKTDAEVRGLDIVYKGTILPQTQKPAVLRVSFSMPYRSKTFIWRQQFPVETLGFTVGTPLSKGRRHVRPIRMTLRPLFDGPEVSTITDRPGTKWRVMRANGLVRKPNELISFEIGNIPAASRANLYFLVGSIVFVLLVVLFGFRAQPTEERTFSKSHMMDERDRLVRALARLKRAWEKGLISDNKHRKEAEAIRARLVSLYRAIDQLDVG